MTRQKELKLLEHYTRKLAKDIPDPAERNQFVRTLCSDVELSTETPADDE